MKKKMLFVGFAIPKDQVSKTRGASVAGNKMQLNIVRGLSSEFDLDCISSYPTASFPAGEKAIIRRNRIELLPGIFSRVPFMINLPFIKNLSRCIHTYTEADKLLREKNIESIFTFNMFPYTSLPVLKLKKKYGCKVFSIIADLPIDDNVNTKGFNKVIRKWFDTLTEEAIQKCDRIVVLNEEAAKRYAPGVPYIVIEGGVDPAEVTEIYEGEKERKNILYAGALQAHNGIDVLLEAMEQIESRSSFMLDIYGNGELRDLVEEKARKLSNVNYCGTVSNAEVLIRMKEAYLLINPRDPNNAISQVTFPSKTFEYLLSGTPVLSTKLNGYTKDFLDNMFIVEEYSAKSMADTIRSIEAIDKEVLAEKGRNARQMVLSKKTWPVQMKKVCSWISG